MPNSKNITFDQLQSALTRVKNSLDKKANTSHGNHVPKTETANNARFLRNDNTWQTITPVNIGAADRSHNHTSLTGVTSLQFAAGSSDSAVMKVTTSDANTYLDFEMNDDAGSDMYRWRFSAYGTNGATPYFNLMTLTAKDTTSARLTVNGDVTASSFTGNATSATKLQTARALKIGNTSKNFDGTGNVTWTLSEIGAAASSHSHSYLPLSGGTISNSGFNSLSIQRSGSTNGASIEFKNNNGTLGYIGMRDSANGGLMRWSADTKIVYTVLDSGNFNTYAAAKSHGTHVTYATAVPLADGTAAVGTSSKVAREDHVHPIQTTVTGNAGTATKLQTARTLTIGNSGKKFDGSANVSWSLSEIGAAATGHTHNKITSRGKVAAETTTTRPAVDGISMTEAYDNGYPTTYGNVITLKGQGDGQILVGWSGSSGEHAPVYVRSKRDVNDANWSSWAQFYTSANPQTSVTGNAGTATKLQTARTLTIGNKGKTFDGSGNVSWTLSEIGAAASSHSHNYVPLNNGGSTTILADSDASTTTEYAQLQAGYNYLRVTSSGGGGTATQGADKLTFNGNVVYHAGRKPTPSEIGAAASSHTHSSIGGYAVGTYNLVGNNVGMSSTSGNGYAFWAGANGADNSGSAPFRVGHEGSLYAANATLTGTLTGNATTATKLQTARTLTIGNTGKNFDGSGNVSWNLSEIGAASSGHTHSSIRGTIGGSWASATINTTDGGLFQFAANVVKTATGIFTTSNNANAIISFGKHSGNYASQLGFNNSGDIFYRSADGSALADSTAWKQIAFTSSSITGNAASATKLQNARNIKIGNTTRSFNGTADVSWTLSDIGAAASSHSHSYLPLGGGTVTGNITFSEVTSTTYPANSSKITWNGSTDGADIYYRVTASDKGQLVLNLRDDADATIGIALNGSVKATFDTNGYYSGKANQANTLATARTLTIGNTGKSFNGSGNVSWSLGEIGAAPSGHTHNQILDGNSNITIAQANDRSGLDGKNNINISSWYGVSISNGCSNAENYNQVTFSVDARNGNVWARGTVNAPTFSGSLSGNAFSATKLQTARAIKIGNTSRNFDGTGNVTWTLSDIGAAASSHTHSYLPLSGGTITGEVTFNNYLSLNAWPNYGSGKAQIWYNGTAKELVIQPTAVTDIRVNHNLVLHAGNYKTYVTPANIGAAKTSHGNHVPATQTANNTKFLRNDNTWATVTPANIGAAAANHTHNYAASSHSHGLLHSNLTVTVPDTTTDNGWSMINSSYNGYILKSIRSNANAPAWLQGNYSAGIAFGGEDTKGVMSVAYNAPSIRFAGGNGTKPVWNMTLTGTSGKSYNMDSLAANTANTLATARTINGTSFNGSANITTANWGTARTITIGSTGKSVNGGGNVTWTWNEMGVPKSQGNYRFGGNSNAITTAQFITLITNAGAFNQFYWISRGTWDYAGNQYINDTGCGNIHLAGCTVECIGSSSSYTIRVHTPTTSSSGVTYGDFIYVNNGKDYSPGWRRLYSNKYKPTPADIGAAAASHGNHVPATQTADNKKFLRNDNTWQTVTPANIGAAAASHSHNYAGSSSAGGNANAAVKLATARSINGTNFDGSGNITTANWGTGRTITIGNKGKTVNGSGNVSWSLSEIGALPTAGGTVSGNLAVSGAFSVGGKKITINSSAPSSPAVGDIWIKI